MSADKRRIAMVLNTAVIGIAVASILSGCSSSGHGASGITTAHANTVRMAGHGIGGTARHGVRGTTTSHAPHIYHMARPAASTAVDVQFIARMYQYCKDALALALAAQAKGRAASNRIAEFAAGMREVQTGNFQELSEWRALLENSSSRNLKPSYQGWPGMPASGQISRLSALTGKPFDRAFLELMIADQQDALHVATLEHGGGRYGPALQFADQIVSSSTLLIVRMRQMLRTLGRRQE